MVITQNVAKTQFLENVSVYDIETYPDEEHDDCVSHSVGCFFVSKRFNTKVHIDLTPDGIEKKTDVFVGESDECVDKMLNHLNWKKKSDPKSPKNKVFIRYDVKLILHNAVQFDKWVVLQKLNSSFYLKADGSID